MSGRLQSRHAYLLDLDGTLVDTHASNLAAYEQAIHEVLPNAIFDESALFAHIAAGESCTGFLPKVLPKVSVSGVRAIAARKAVCYPMYLHLSRLNEALVSQARAWCQTGGLVALVTTAKRVNAMHVIERHHISDLFDRMIFGDGIARPKPAPDIYLKALAACGVGAANATAFEDSDVGIAAARAAGIAVTRVAFSHWLPAP